LEFRVVVIGGDRHPAHRIRATRRATFMFVSLVPSVAVHHVRAAAEPHHEVEESSKQ
jgi:hypothetical protein